MAADSFRVSVRSRGPNGFYRAGRYWSATPTEVDVPADVLARLEAENLLDVRRLGAAPVDASASRPAVPPTPPAPTVTTDAPGQVVVTESAPVDAPAQGSSSGKRR